MLYHNINPVFISLGFIEIRYYSLAYIIGAILALMYIKYNTKYISLFSDPKIKKLFYDDMLFFILLGIILGGRLGYVIFYGFSYYITHPLHILYIWQGGMSFHGALIGGLIAIKFLSQKYKISYLRITDIITPAIPIGLLLGRIANFINAELYGKPTNVPWGVIFPNEAFARHPSQLYEAFLEGLVLFIVLFVLWKKEYYKKTGYITAIGLILYSIFRIFVEIFREPEIYIISLLSMGQFLTLPMLIVGIYILLQTQKNIYDKK